MFGFKKKEKTENEESFKDQMEKKLISSSFVNPEITGVFVDSMKEKTENLKIMELLLRKDNRFEEAKKLAEKLRNFFDGKLSLVSMFALTSMMMEIEASGFLHSKIKPIEEMMKDLVE
jgi:hypothetical protein